jgi:AbrB family looped-hinge helix DNA binding protein
MNKDSKPCEMVKIQTRGQVTLPICFRKHLGVDENTWLVMYLEGDRIIIKKVDEEKIK